MPESANTPDKGTLPESNHTDPLLPQVDSKTWIALTYTALVMSLVYYFGKSNHSFEYFPEFFKALYTRETIAEHSFYSKVYWVVFGITVYFIK